ncbi:AAA family ATPase [uncultured Mobiluncus sp.]|uniref:AAA family ATPase n=1 Tax=uncultured Mobiluncus sp. TaxID=293425 RepID=UPI002602E954|nr:AAA family ATPase [uncultured Mobiluncus sp.]
MGDKHFTWIDFYTKFADQLLAYRDDRESLIRKLQAVFANLGMDLPTLDSVPVPPDIDPFTVFGLFNKGMIDSKRKAIITSLAQEFSVSAQPVEDFNGIPVLMPQMATYYGFQNDSRRQPSDIDNLWLMYRAALDYAKDKSALSREAFIENFDRVRKQFAVKWNLTMALYWIRPHDYMSLESRNRWYLTEASTFENSIRARIKEQRNALPTGSQYLEICDSIEKSLNTGSSELRTFYELSHEAFLSSESENQRLKQKANETPIRTAVVAADDDSDDSIGDFQPYSTDDFLAEVYLDTQEYEDLRGILGWKKNIILQGPPGVGKTFAARRLAYSMMGTRDSSRVELVQFHQSYSYEDFVMGYKPDGSGFALKDGVFKRFCDLARIDSDNEYYFIIDEINRGNLSQIFGELLVLLEADKRDKPATLAYTDEPFSVPGNLYVIGMMNTADRSLALIDYALRRRFSFFEMKPAFASQGFQQYQSSLANENFNTVVRAITELNQDITGDPALGKGFCIGHSYLCGTSKDKIKDEWLRAVLRYDIIPLLEEYWFDEPEKLDTWKSRLEGLIQ